ncbi:sensor histidine kinase [Catenulispora yoronensis]
MAPTLRVGLGLSVAVLALGAALVDRRPLTAHTLVLAGAVGTALTFNSTMVAFTQFTTVAVPLVHLAATRPRRTSLTALGITLAVVIAYGLNRAMQGWPVVVPTQVAVALAAVVVWLLGDALRQTREHTLALSEHEAAQAATTERLRIAREVHDMVAHTVGVIALQAGAAVMLLDAEPDKARQAVEAIESSSRETLSGLRRMLTSLRSRDADSEGTAPMPGLGDLERLAAETTAAGVRVELEMAMETAPGGERRALPAEIELAAYRIVQESVTNVVRHAGTDRCRVVVRCEEGELRIEVTDEGISGGAKGGTGVSAETGYKLIGIRERVGLLGGEFAAGAGAGGGAGSGFRVVARLPVGVAGSGLVGSGGVVGSVGSVESGRSVAGVEAVRSGGSVGLGGVVE